MTIGNEGTKVGTAMVTIIKSTKSRATQDGNLQGLWRSG